MSTFLNNTRGLLYLAAMAVKGKITSFERTFLFCT